MLGTKYIHVVKDAWLRATKDDQQGFVIPRFFLNLALPLTEGNIYALKPTKIKKGFTTFTHREDCGLCGVTPGSVESA